MSEPTTEGSDNPAVRYRELTALATSAVDRVREHERERAARLEDGLAASAERITAAEQAQQKVVDGVRIRWNAAMEALWSERWMRVTARPDPDMSAPAARAEECIRRVQAAYLELHAAVDRRSWSATSWLPGRGRRSAGREG